MRFAPCALAAGLAAVLAAGSARAAEPASPASADAPAPPVVLEILDNGVTFVHQARPGSGTFAFRLALRGGWAEDPDDALGLSGVLASSLLRGSATRTAREQARALDGAGILHSTSAGIEAIVLSASGSADAFDTAFAVLADALTAPRFDPADVAKEVALARQTYRTERDVPSGDLWRTVRPLVFGRHPLGRVIDRERHLDGVDAKAIRAAYAARLAGRRLVAVVVGDVDGARARRAVAGALSDVAAGEKAQAMPRPEPLKDERRAHAKARTSQPEIVVVVPTTGVPAGDEATMDVLSHLLGGFQERLSGEIREKRGWAYWLATTDWRLPGAGLFGIHTAVPKKRLDETEAIIRAELNRIASEPPSPEEVERARRFRETALARNWQTSAGRAGLLLADVLHGREPLGYQARAERLGAVTPERIRALARRLFDFSKPAVVTLH